MKIIRIFENPKKGYLRAVCYPEDKMMGHDVDIFQKLTEQWADSEYVTKYVSARLDLLITQYWEEVPPDDVISQIVDEAHLLETRLRECEISSSGFTPMDLKNIFKPLHENITSLSFREEDFRKGKAPYRKPILRIYAIELEDGTYVITGGAIKLKRKMEGEEFEIEMKRLRVVKRYLAAEGIIDSKGLEEG